MQLVWRNEGKTRRTELFCCSCNVSQQNVDLCCDVGPTTWLIFPDLWSQWMWGWQFCNILKFWLYFFSLFLSNCCLMVTVFTPNGIQSKGGKYVCLPVYANPFICSCCVLAASSATSAPCAYGERWWSVWGHKVYTVKSFTQKRQSKQRGGANSLEETADWSKKNNSIYCLEVSRHGLFRKHHAGRVV